MTDPGNAESAEIGEKHLDGPRFQTQIETRVERSNESGLFSIESVLNILKLIFTGSPLPEVLRIIARLVESQGDGLSCTIWLLDEDGKYLHCATAPSLPGFVAQIGRTEVCAKGASCGTAVYRRESVYVSDILTDPIWEDYRDRVLPYGIRSAWSRPLFTREGKSLGAFSVHYGEPRSPSAADLQLIENASDITGIAIERHFNEEQLRRTEAYLTEAERLSHSGSFVWDVNRPGPSYWSAEMCRIHGRDPSQSPPNFEEDRSLQSTEDWAGLMAAAEKSARDKTDIDYDSELFFPDGSTKNIRIVAHPVVNLDGDVVQFVGTTIDITEQHRAKAALKSALTEITKSEVRLRTIIDTIPAMAWCALPDGFAEFHNQRWLDYTGLTDEEGRGWGWRTVFHPDDSQAAVDDWRDIIASKQPAEGERLIRRFDGEYRRYMFRAEPLMDEQGNVVRWYGTITDIEDLKRAEDSLRSSEQNFRRIVNSIPGYVCALTASGEIEFVNNQVLEYFGKTLDELKNWAASDTVYPDDLPQVIATLRTSIETGQPSDVELRLRRADGIYRWFLLRRVPQRDSYGHVVRWYTLLTDIEDRKQAEDKIRRSEAEFRQIVDFAPQSVVVLAPDRGRTRLYANQMALDYLGFTLEGWRMTDRHNYFHSDDWERLTRETQSKFLGGLPHEFEVRIRRKDGKYRWFLTRWNPLKDEQGRVTRWYSATFDIDDLKQAQQRLQNENIALREEVDHASMFEEIVGSSAALRGVLSQVAKVAPTESTVLILGETGTGKELIARAIHNRSNRPTRAFVRVNCAAIPQSLIASELFGHEKGAFTGATQRRLGRFELAHEGTIFLDEVGELPAETQITLLRVLQEREFERVGGSQSISVDVRVLAATNRNLNAAVDSGSFRQDLFYRLNVFPIEIPPL